METDFFIHWRGQPCSTYAGRKKQARAGQETKIADIPSDMGKFGLFDDLHEFGDGVIDEKLYLEKVREYKTRQFEIADEMKNHEKADQNFYVTANMVLNLAARAKEIFLSSEVDEKRQLLSLVFQNLQLRGVNLSVSV